MLPSYTFALGGTDKLKQIIEWIESQDQVMDTIIKKYAMKDSYGMENSE